MWPRRNEILRCQNSFMVYQLILIIAAVSCFVSIWILYPFAVKVRLVDSPNDRKRHSGEVPLIGGIAMFIGFVISLLVAVPDLNQVRGFLIGSTIIVFVGALDDYSEISVRIRIALQLSAILIMTSFSGMILFDLGNILGTGPIKLADWSIPFTVIAAIGAINTLNLTDGLDGLAGTSALVCFLSLSCLYYLSGELALMPLLFIGVLLPFLWKNLSSVRKIFMGDAGSMFLGFGTVWMLIEASQGESAVMTPVTGLWILAIPLIDTVAIMFRRILKGQSPFLADREHLHHIFLRAGFSDKATLYIMSMLSIIFASFGVLGVVYQIPESIMFVLFLSIFICYLWVIRKAWWILKTIRQYINS